MRLAGTCLQARERRQSKTETDTEVIAQVIEDILNGRPVEDAACKSVQQPMGDDSLAILFSKEPNKIPRARFGPPSATGLGQECFVASDILAILRHARDILFLTDNDLAVLSAEGIRAMEHGGHPIERPVERVAWPPAMTGNRAARASCKGESLILSVPFRSSHAEEKCIARPLLAAGGQDI